MTQYTSEIKAAVLISYAPFVALCSYLGIDNTSISIMLILIVADFVTGLLKAIVMGEGMTYKRFYNGLISKVVLFSLPFLAALVVKALGIDYEAMLYTLITILILSEFYSNLSNIYTIRTGKKVDEYDPVAALLKLIQRKLNKLIPEE